MIIYDRYRHKKTGNIYKLLTVGKDADTTKEVAIYTRLEGPPPNYTWVRPWEDFQEKFEHIGAST